MSSNSDQELVCGLNTVNQIIISRPKSVQSLYVGKVQNARIESVVDEAKKK
jgi:tRNA G18 (ribose-2'-O)-methylase SpoU